MFYLKLGQHLNIINELDNVINSQLWNDMIIMNIINTLYENLKISVCVIDYAVVPAYRDRGGSVLVVKGYNTPAD